MRPTRDTVAGLPGPGQPGLGSGLLALSRGLPKWRFVPSGPDFGPQIVPGGWPCSGWRWSRGAGPAAGARRSTSDLWLFVTRPISGFLLALSVLSVAVALWQRRRSQRGPAEPDVDF